MKTTTHGILKLLRGSLIVMLMMLTVTSCKEDRADMTGLLSTVPSSAGGVISLDLKSILQDMGCKIDKNVIKPGKEVSEFLSTMKDKERAELLKLLNGESGISPECAVVFFDANRCFLTVSLDDVEAFCKFMENDKGQSFVDQGSGVRICGNVAVKGAQAWICLSSGKRIDGEAISAYSSLKNSQSFLSNPMASRFVEPKNDIVGWGSIQTLLSGTMSRGNMSVLTLGMGFLFEDASDLAFSIDFEKGFLQASATILNEEGKPAKYLMPSEKINTSTIEGLGESCDAMIAFTLTPKMVSKIGKIGSAIGGNLFGDLTSYLKNVDGTIGALWSNPTSGEYRTVTGVVTTKGEVSQQLKDIISNMVAPVREDGKLLRFSNGLVSGRLNVKESCDKLKGSCLGGVINLQGLKEVNGSLPAEAGSFENLIFTMNPDSGGLTFKFTLTGSDSKENILVSLLRN